MALNCKSATAPYCASFYPPSPTSAATTTAAAWKTGCAFPWKSSPRSGRRSGADYTLGIRLCADEMVQGGLTLDDVKEIARRFEASQNIDFIDLTLATFYNLYLVGATMHTPLGYTIPLAAGIKSVVSLPVFCTGRINDPVMAERVLANGQADMIGMVRAQICDPEMANKAKEGRLDEIRFCVADNQGCYGRVGLNKTIGCIQNPHIGREKDAGGGFH